MHIALTMVFNVLIGYIRADIQTIMSQQIKSNVRKSCIIMLGSLLPYRNDKGRESIHFNT